MNNMDEHDLKDDVIDEVIKEENDLEHSFIWKSKTRFRRRMKEWDI